jgi:hypothetical protein
MRAPSCANGGNRSAPWTEECSMLRRARALVFAGLAAGCYQGVDAGSRDAQGDGGEAGGSDDGADGSDGADSDDGGEPVDESCSESVDAPTTIVRQLNRREYANTVRDLTDLAPDAVAEIVEQFPVDAIVGFDNHAESLVASDVLVEQQLFAAEAIADAVDPLGLVSCDPAAEGEDACVDALVTAFGRRAFRRPLSPDEHAAASAVYTRARDEGRTFDAALRLVVRTLLISPRFLYRIETGVADDGGPADVDAFELASRLSYFFWASMPDDALLDGRGGRGTGAAHARGSACARDRRRVEPPVDAAASTAEHDEGRRARARVRGVEGDARGRDRAIARRGALAGRRCRGAAALRRGVRR